MCRSWPPELTPRAAILCEGRDSVTEQVFCAGAGILSLLLPTSCTRTSPSQCSPSSPTPPQLRCGTGRGHGEKGYTSDGGGGYHWNGSGGGNGGGRWEDMGSSLIGVKFGRGGAVWGGAGRKQFNLAVRQAEIRYKDGDIHACPTAPFQQFFLHFALHHKSRCLPHLLFLVL